MPVQLTRGCGKPAHRGKAPASYSTADEEIYEIYDEENFFDLLVALGDGSILPVWVSEVEKLDADEV